MENNHDPAQVLIQVYLDSSFKLSSFASYKELPRSFFFFFSVNFANNYKI